MSKESREDISDKRKLIDNLIKQYGKRGALDRTIECLLSVSSLVEPELEKSIMEYMIGDYGKTEDKSDR